MTEIRKILILAVLAAACVGCKPKEAETISFPRLQKPPFITNPLEKRIYVANNYWNAFFSCADRVDTLDLEKGVASFSKLLKVIPVKDAAKAVRIFSAKLEESDTTTYSRLTRLFEKYFFDPDSPVRDEDMYGVFAALRAESGRTPEDMREAYRADAAICALNARESIAADFRYRTAAGVNGNLYSLNANKILVVFNNPGCENCEETLEAIRTNGAINFNVEKGLLTILFVYVDEDLQPWLDAAGLYPDNCINAYDPGCSIRNEQRYSLRAIPSLYLLDKDKKVILKDAPFAEVLKKI